jgi:DNA primase
LTNTTPTIDLDRLKQAMPIMDLAKSLGLEIRERQARCYNSTAHKHNDRSFSLGLDINHNRYKCFACGEQGSIIDLLMAIKGLNLSQAIKEIAEMTGLTPMRHQTHQRTTSTPYKAEIRQPEASREKTRAYSNIYEELCFICGGLDQESRAYLTGATRGLTEDTLNRFLLFSVSDYKKINQHLKDKFSRDELQGAGVISDGDNLVFYKHKVLIPFLSEGRIIYLRGRYLFNGNAETDGAKMLGLKGQTTKRLFNADRLADLEKGDKVYICEGEFDTMILDQHGYNAVGVLGTTNFNADDIELFKGFEVVLALDNDEAGERATKELAKMFLLKGQRVKSKQLPDGVKDITDYFIKL